MNLPWVYITPIHLEIIILYARIPISVQIFRDGISIFRCFFFFFLLYAQYKNRNAVIRFVQFCVGVGRLSEFFLRSLPTPQVERRSGGGGQTFSIFVQLINALFADKISKSCYCVKCGEKIMILHEKKLKLYVLGKSYFYCAKREK